MQSNHIGIDANVTADVVNGDALVRDSTTGRFKERASGVEIHFFSVIQTGNIGFEWTNFPAALTEAFGAAIHRRIKDLRGYTQWRLAVNQGTTSSAGSVIGAQYSLDAGANWNGLDNGTAATQSTTTVDVATTGTLTSAWAAINTAARIADVMLRITGSGGDGAADPVFSLFVMEVR